MKIFRIFIISLFFPLSSHALTLFSDPTEDIKIDFYANIRAHIGYAYSDNFAQKVENNFLYSLQLNSRVGFIAKIKRVSIGAELGFNEATFLNSNSSALGFRYLYSKYHFSNGGALTIGKVDTPSNMYGFLSTFYDYEDGLNGFGGVKTGTRRFQLQYVQSGFAVALVEKQNFTNDNENAYIPRLSASYSKRNENLFLKFAFSYTLGNIDASKATEQTDNSGKGIKTVHAYGATFGIRPSFFKEKFFFAILLRGGVNEDQYSEAKTSVSRGSFFTPNEFRYSVYNNKVYDIIRFSVGVEFGSRVNKYITLALGGGYQGTIMPKPNSENQLLSSYAVYLQAYIRAHSNLHIIPEVGYYANTMHYIEGKGRQNNGFFFGVQGRIII